MTGLKIRLSNIFCCSGDRDRFWFRVFGRGLSFRHATRTQALFSERNGYRKAVKVGAYMVKWLKKERVITVAVPPTLGPEFYATALDLADRVGSDAMRQDIEQLREEQK